MTLRPYSQTLQQAYRDTLGTPGAPEAIDDGQPVVPVAVVAQVNTAQSSSFTRITDGTDTAAVNSDGALNVAIRGLPRNGQGQTYKAAQAATAFTSGADTAALLTPTAGTTVFITTFMFDPIGGTAGQKTLIVKDNATEVFRLVFNVPSTYNAVGPVILTFPTPVPISTSLKLNYNETATFRWSLNGYEEAT